MRPADRERLSAPFVDGSDRNVATVKALGIETPRWKQLEENLLADLTIGPPYGMSWMAATPSAKLRILVSDYLYCCAESVATHLKEAAIHWLELQECVDKNVERFSGSVSLVNGEPIPQTRPAKNPLENLTTDFVSMHKAGMVRAIASALDCAAGVSVGVLALPVPILKAGWPAVRRVLGKIPLEGDDVVIRRRYFGDSLELAILECGPTGWLDWVLDYRNMLVHRGRRIELGQFIPRRVPRVDALGNLQPVVDLLMQLPRDPARSDVEVRLDDGQPHEPVLTEVAEVTALGAMVSARTLIESIAVLVSDFLGWRRGNPAQVIQPDQQCHRSRPVPVEGRTDS